MQCLAESGSFSLPVKKLKAGKIWTATDHSREISGTTDRASRWRKVFIEGKETHTCRDTKKKTLCKEKDLASQEIQCLLEGWGLKPLKSLLPYFRVGRFEDGWLIGSSAAVVWPVLSRLWTCRASLSENKDARLLFQVRRKMLAVLETNSFVT